jgi:hypothetical protein
MGNVKDSFFYAEHPSTAYPRQADVVEFLFLKRPRAMHFQGDPTGKTENKWSECTKQDIFLPLFDSRSEMNIMYQTQHDFVRPSSSLD